MQNRAAGFVLAIIGLLILSPDAGLTRYVQMEVWSLVFWRGVGLFATVGLISVLYYRQRLFAYWRGLSWHAWAIVPLYGTVPLMWILAVKWAGGGQVLSVLAIAPLVAGFTSRLFLGEPIGRATLVACLFAMLGVLIVAAETVFATGESNAVARHRLYIWGVLLSFVIPIFYAFVMTFSRKIERANSWPIISLSGLVMVVAGWLMAPQIVLPSDPQQLTGLLMLVFVVGSLSTGFLTLATRFTTAADVTLVVMLEPVLGVVYLWWLVSEGPTAFQWVGGGIIFLTVALYMIQQLTGLRLANLMRPFRNRQP